MQAFGNEKPAIQNLGVSKEFLFERMELASSWICDIAQVKNEGDIGRTRHKHVFWIGSVRGEYSAAKKEWSFFCPVWHTGQAVKALARAYAVTGNRKFLNSAEKGAEFIIKNQIQDKFHEDYGLILAYEDHPDKVNVSAILESLDGLLVLDDILKNNRYSENVLAAVDWVARKAWIEGEGLFRDLYDPADRQFISGAYGTPGRPLLDDAIFLKAFNINSEDKHQRIFYETADRLLADEFPSGNWIKYKPCNKDKGNIHPRHAYWWGAPMLNAYAASGNKKYLECAERACRWYVNAQRPDGGLFRETYVDFKTSSFGHATSGMACAMIMWEKISRITGTQEFAEPLARALEYCLNMQFIEPEDPDLKGAILEKVLPPDGSDKSPYHIRDLGSIFFIQAITGLL